jgi:NAD(P)H dehydrogenase (quinone)
MTNTAQHTATQTGKPILVTGATGRQGGTGRAVARVLLERGMAVRALVRTLDERAEALRELGLDIVVGDFGNYRSLVAALDGVESAYFCYPVAAGVAEAAGFFAGAGREQGLKRIVDLSLATTRVDSPSPQGRAQWVAEQIFEWAGFGGVHLRIAAFFMENILLTDGDNIRRNGRILLCQLLLSNPSLAILSQLLVSIPGLTQDGRRRRLLDPVRGPDSECV